MRRTLLAIALVAASSTAVLALAAADSGRPPAQPGPPHGGPPGQPANPHDPGEGSCDADGVSVHWDTGYHADDPAAYRVEEVRVDDIAVTCAGGGLSVKLFRDSAMEDLIGEGSAPVTSMPSMSVPMDPRPRASEVVHVAIEIAGGETPIPPECLALGLRRVLIGTTGDDGLTGSPFNDLVYGVGGANTIEGLAGDDCLVGGTGDDTILGDAGSDVVIVEHGANTVDAGPGSDRIHVKGDHNVVLAGAGNDRIWIGGDNNEIDGGSGNDICYVVPGGIGNTIRNCQQAEWAP